jgi:hypothetical protein
MNAESLGGLLSPMHASDRLTASKWLSQIDAGDMPSSNVEAQDLPFQRWYRFKEAFSPRFVSSAIASLDKRPQICVDPFGGSGTTALPLRVRCELPWPVRFRAFQRRHHGIALACGQVVAR